MRIRKSIQGTALGVLLIAFSGIVQASPGPQSNPTATKQALPKSNSKSVTGVSRGTITTIDNDRLVLTHKKNGKAEEMTFMLTPKTERKGNLTSGARVNVHYRTGNGQLMATVIQATPQKTASNAAKKPVVSK